MQPVGAKSNMADSTPSDLRSLDPEALKILFQKYWSATGWTKGAITQVEFDYAKQAGLMFEPVDISHDEIVERAVEIRKRITPKTVGNAFLASLSSRRMDWRSSLGSLAAILHLPTHSLKPHDHSKSCAVCGAYPDDAGLDVNLLNFERLKWGGVRHHHPHYAILDLEWFLSRPLPQPTTKDLDIFSAVLEKMAQLEITARPADLEKALKGVLPSNSSERRKVIDILGLAGVLIPRDRPTFWGEYPFNIERDHPGNKNDWSYPILWWRGSDGINRDAVKFWFPDAL